VRCLVYIEVPTEVGNRMDFDEGGGENPRICHEAVRARSVVYTGRHARCFHGGRP